MKSTVFSKYLKHMKMHSQSNWLLELLRTNMSNFTPERMVNESQNTEQESYQCIISDRRFRTNRGLSQHLRSCQYKNINCAHLSKSREHLKALARRMVLWLSGEILDLLHEGEKIQKPSNTPSTAAKISKKFTREIHKGNVTNAMMKLLTDSMQNGIVPLNQKTLNQLNVTSATKLFFAIK